MVKQHKLEIVLHPVVASHEQQQLTYEENSTWQPLFAPLWPKGGGSAGEGRDKTPELLEKLHWEKNYYNESRVAQ